jgi:Flp pilus assembly protein TadD
VSAYVSTPQAAVEPADITPAESTLPAEGVQDSVSAVADESAAEVVAATSPPVETATPYQLLAAAREAFWMHDYAGAEASYRKLIALEPDNPDGYGELGNMYFTQGNWEQAAATYFDAGKNLVNEGRIRQADVLVNVIRGLNGPQADELAQLIAAAREPNTGTR